MFNPYLLILAGQGKGFDIDLINLISDAVSIPVIASSDAGAVEHFLEVFTKTNASAALAAGIFHWKVSIQYRISVFPALWDKEIYIFPSYTAPCKAPLI